MAIDTGALRRFQDLWEPVLQAIPAVIELDAKQAEMERWLATKRLEFDKAQKEIEAAYAEADKRLEQHNAAVTDAVAQVAKANEDAVLIRSEAAASAKQFLDAAQVKLAAVNAQISEREQALLKVDAQHAAKLAALDAAHAEAVSAKEAEIVALEKRQATAEKALESLRAKLG